MMEGKTTDALTTGVGRTRKRAAPWLFGGLVLLLLSVLVLLQVFGLWEVFTPDTASDTLLLYALSSLNFAAFIVFTFIFVRSLLKLRRERRERLLGSKIKTRLVVYFIAVSLLPITAMAVFSYMFFNRSLEKWFGSLPQDVVRQARQAQEESARDRADAVRDYAQAVAVSLVNNAEKPPNAQILSAYAQEGSLAVLALVNGENGDVQQAAFGNGRALSETELSELVRLANSAGPEVFTFEAGGVAYDVSTKSLPNFQVLVAAREQKEGESLKRLIAGAQTFEDFKRNQRKVRLLGLSTLGLLTLLLLFAATWSAIHLARGIGTPIRALAEAADEVAAGNLDHRVDAIADDELAVLAASFNDMTAQLSENRRRIERNAAELNDKNLALEERRNYIETVLRTLSTGVVSLDEANRVTTINDAARSMLRLELVPEAAPLCELIGAEDFAVIEHVSVACASARARLGAGGVGARFRERRHERRRERLSERRSEQRRRDSRRAHGHGALTARRRDEAGRRARHRRPFGTTRRATRRRMERGRASPRARD